MSKADDLVSRQAVIEELWKEPSYTDPLNVLTEARDRIEALPSAQPERKKGKWIIKRDCEGKTRKVICPLCWYESHELCWHDPNFCPNCGADMRGEEE